MKISSAVLAALSSTFIFQVSASHTCGPDEKIDITSRNMDGCVMCPPYTRAQNQNKDCEADRCASNQITRINGKCEACRQGTFPDERHRSCVAQQFSKCNDHSILSANGQSCELCPLYQRAFDGNTRCGADTCSRNQILGTEGRCQNCPSGYVASPNQRNCVLSSQQQQYNAPQYDQNYQISQNVQQQQYYPQQQQCQTDQTLVRGFCQCLNGQPVVNGYCQQQYDIQISQNVQYPQQQQYDNNYSYSQNVQYPQQTNYQISSNVQQQGSLRPQVTCQSGWQILSSDGTYCETCPKYTRPQIRFRSELQSGKEVCASDECYQNQIVLQDGKCYNCPNNLIPDELKRDCIDLPQETKQIGMMEFQIQKQEIRVGSTSLSSNQVTIPTNNFEITVTETLPVPGVVISVPEYNDPKGCNQVQIKSSKGDSCENCPEYTRAQSGNVCAADKCKRDEIYTLDGQCHECAIGLQPNFYKHKCISSTPIQSFCRYDQIELWFQRCKTCRKGSYPNYERNFCISIDAGNRKTTSIRLGASIDIQDDKIINTQTDQMNIREQIKKNPVPVIIGFVSIILCLTLGTLRFTYRIRSQKNERQQESNEVGQEMTQSNEANMSSLPLADEQITDSEKHSATKLAPKSELEESEIFSDLQMKQNV